MKNKQNKQLFTSILVIQILILFSSCQFFGKQTEKQVFQISGTVLTSFHGERSAFPSINSTDLEYELSAVCGETTKTVERNSSPKFQFNLEEGTWTITAKVYESSTAVSPKYSGSAATIISSENQYDTEIYIVASVDSSEYSSLIDSSKIGYVNLPVQLESGAKVTTAKVYWNDISNVEQTETITFDSSGKANITMNTDEASSVGINCGCYEIRIEFYYNTVFVFSCLSETVCVYDGNTTDTWFSSVENPVFYLQSTYDGKCSFVVPADVGSNIRVYVSGNGSDSNLGFTAENPLKTVKHAYEILTNLSGYTGEIVLTGDVEEASTESLTSTENYACLNFDFTGAEKSFNLSIYSYNSPETPYKINFNRSSTQTGRGIYIGKNAVLTLKDVQITGCYTDENGAGIYLSNDGTLNISGTVIINDNKTSDGSKKNNLCLAADSSANLKTINVSDNLAESDIGVTVENQTEVFKNKDIVSITSGFGKKNDLSPENYFESDTGLSVVWDDSAAKNEAAFASTED